jgi:hypothetical protein
MTAQQNRRDFLKQGIDVGVGLMCCCAGLSCSKKSQQKESSKKSALDTGAAGEDFSKFSYCGLVCGEKCKVFRATKNNDSAAKAEIAKEWSEKYGKDFKPEDVHCSGCKTENIPVSYYAAICEVRNCARQRQVITCAHCGDFPACQKQTWTDWPAARKLIEQIRSKLQAQNAAGPNKME